MSLGGPTSVNCSKCKDNEVCYDIKSFSPVYRRGLASAINMMASPDTNCTATWVPPIYQTELNHTSSVGDGSSAEVNYSKLQRWHLTWPRNLWLHR